MASFCAVLFPRDVLNEIWDLIESVSEVFLPTLKTNEIMRTLVSKTTSQISKSCRKMTSRYRQSGISKISLWFIKRGII